MGRQERHFAQVDVFASEALRGNPVAVVIDGDGLSDAEMALFARWTHLSETTFLLPAKDPTADYRLRIFTPGGELPFAGHPTLGSAHAWLRAGGVPKNTGAIVQECGVGLVELRSTDAGLAFAAPPLVRDGDVDAELLARVADALGIPPESIVASAWVDNGPGWVAVMLGTAEEALALRPDFSRMGSLKVGVIAPQPDGADTRFEVRAFAPGIGVDEDPVTGSLNAGLALWLIGAGLAPERYQAAQGTALGRAGRVDVERLGGTTWIGGATETIIDGTVLL